MSIERVEQRVLGALRLVDLTTGASLNRAVNVKSDQLTLRRNLRGYYVITSAAALEGHTEEFQTPPPNPPMGALTYKVTVTDPLQQYLPRNLTLALPRDPDPTNRGNSNSLFKPQDVVLFPASTSRLAHNWSTVRVSVKDAEGTAVRGALIHLINVADGALMASGISDDRGEALVIAPGVPVTRFADDEETPPAEGEPPVLVNTVSVRFELSVSADRTWPADPDALALSHSANLKQTMPLTLTTAQSQSVVIELT